MFRTFLSTIYLITAIAMFFVWTGPFYRDIQTLKNQKTSYEKFLIGSRKIQEIRDDLLVQYNSVASQDIDRLNKIIPEHPNSIKFILELERIIQKSGVVLKNIDVAIQDKTKDDEDSNNSKKISFPSRNNLNDKGEGLAKITPVQVSVSGSYGDFYTFLGNLENNLRLIDIKNINFSSSDTSNYEFVISAVVYSRR